MLSHHSQAPDPDCEQSASFTLATALALLGHECGGHCPVIATEHPATVWFAQLPPRNDGQRILPMVEVDFGEVPWTGRRTRSLLKAINQCLQPDGISVRQREGLTLAQVIGT